MNSVRSCCLYVGLAPRTDLQIVSPPFIGQRWRQTVRHGTSATPAASSPFLVLAGRPFSQASPRGRKLTPQEVESIKQRNAHVYGSSGRGWNGTTWTWTSSGSPFPHSAPPPPPPGRKLTSMRSIALIAGCAALLFYYANLQTVPVSGRRRFNCFPNWFVERLADEEMERVMEEINRHFLLLPSWDWRSRMVTKVMNRLVPVSGLDGGSDRPYAIHVIDAPHQSNAFVLPNRQVFVFSGLLRVARTEDMVAAVLGHELAHNLAQHGGERMSTALGPNILMLGALAMGLVLGSLPLLLLHYFGSGPLDIVFRMPMDRRQEAEADMIGLMIMAEACYDPRASLAFWTHFDELSRRGVVPEGPEFLSTHPSNQHRAEMIKKWLPRALEKRESSDCQGTATFARQFKKAMAGGFTM